MAKKSKKRKKQQRRHHFVQQTNHMAGGQPQSDTTMADSGSSDQSAVTLTSSAASQSQTTSVESHRPSDQKSTSAPIDQQLAGRIHYMKRDSRLTAIVAGSIMVGLLILWILFDHTGLGPHIYRLINFS